LFEFDNIVVRIILLWNKEILNLQESRCSQMLVQESSELDHGFCSKWNAAEKSEFHVESWA
jgi:hypothetical protein